ncbi:hypothetical protein [Pantoea coffeiphila]|nr:hypothetical protein [Pantoea coffeiphila]MBM7345134.1 hypothetical protein [Pantoea coffeiphila]
MMVDNSAADSLITVVSRFALESEPEGYCRLSEGVRSEMPAWQ